MWTSPGPTPLPTGAVRKSGQVPGPRQSLAASAPPHALEAGPLTRHHEREVEALLHRLAVHLIGQCGEAHVLLVDVLVGAGGSGARWGSWGSPVPWPLPSSGQGAAGQGPQGGVISMAEVGEGLWAKALEVEGRWGWRVEAPARASQGPRWSLCACGGGSQAQRARRCPPLGWWAEGTRTQTPHTRPRPSEAGEAPTSILTPPECKGWEAPSGPDPAAGVAGCCDGGAGAIYRQRRPASRGLRRPPQDPGPAAPVASPVRARGAGAQLTHLPLPSPHTP